MRTNCFVRQIARPVGAVALAMAVSACNLETQPMPAVSGPSEFGLALTFSAAPDTVPRDGSSMSVVTLTARDASGNPAAGQRVTLTLTPEYGGTLSPAEIVTGSDGRATFEFMAPASNVPVDVVSIAGTPVGQNFDNTTSRSMSIRLLGPGAANAAFIASPSAPERLQPVTFDATGTTVSFATCGDTCTYTWNFGDQGSATGRIATHQFTAAGTYQVRLTVSHPDRPTATITQSVTVSEGTLTPRIQYSPTNPQPGNTVYFDARDTTASGGATIAEYAWDYGNGSTGTGVTGYATYQQDRTYVVRLTVRDSFGRTATTTQEVSVTEPD
jgi:chitodextrinase